MSYLRVCELKDFPRKRVDILANYIVAFLVNVVIDFTEYFQTLWTLKLSIDVIPHLDFISVSSESECGIPLDEDAWIVCEEMVDVTLLKIAKFSVIYIF